MVGFLLSSAQVWWSSRPSFLVEVVEDLADEGVNKHNATIFAMWLLAMLGGVFCMALVNYADEYLTRHNPVPASSDMRKRIGGLLLISSIFSIFGVIGIKFAVGDVSMDALPLALALLSGIPMVFTWAMYFLLLNKFPVYQVIPLFQLTAIWLLFIEIALGGHATLAGTLGVFILVVSAYILDVGRLKWVIPSKLLFVMIGVTLVWAVTQYIVRVSAGLSSGAGAVSFWQYISITGIGVILFFAIKSYRDGFLTRIRQQGKSFLGISTFNEGTSQVGYVLQNYAIALAPLAAYASAVGGVQGIFVLLLFLLFPQKEVTINRLQMAAIVFMAFGVFLLEVGR